VTSGESAANPGCGVSDSSWHGTHVSGTIGAIANNSAGVAGINQVSQIQPLRVLGKCGGYLSDIADAIRWGAGLHVNGIDDNTTPDRVLNLSLGGSGGCGTTLQCAIDAATVAGTVVVVAAGNSNANASNFQPANCNNVITVAATGPTGKKAYYSNFGSTVEIAAPGGDSTVGSTILSTLNAGATVPTTDTYEHGDSACDRHRLADALCESEA
jgi:serine protease